MANFLGLCCLIVSMTMFLASPHTTAAFWLMFSAAVLFLGGD